MRTMAEEKKDEVESKETEEKIEKSEEPKKEETSEKPSDEEEEQKKEDKILEPEEPQTRFSEKEKQEQSKEERRLGFELRKTRKKVKELEGEDYENDEEVEDEDKPLTRREFKEEMVEKEKKDSSENLLRSFLDQYPDYKKYTARIRKYMNHEDYKNVPIGFIADGIAGRDLEAKGAKQQKQADEEAEETSTGGSSKRGIPKKKGVWDMSKDEFQAHQDEVRQKGRDL